MLVVDARKPWKTVGELTAFLKEKGDKATYASVAVTARIMGALYRDAAGLKAVEVQYKSTLSSLNDMTGGAIDFAWHDPTFAMSQAREGRVRILAVASGTRIDTMPEIPTMAENGVPANLVGWFAAMVPAKTPKPVVDQLNVWLSEIVRRPETKKFLNDSGSDAWATMPEEGQKFFQQQLVDWKRYIEQAKIEQDG